MLCFDASCLYPNGQNFTLQTRWNTFIFRQFSMYEHFRSGAQKKQVDGQLTIYTKPLSFYLSIPCSYNQTVLYITWKNTESLDEISIPIDLWHKHYIIVKWVSVYIFTVLYFNRLSTFTLQALLLSFALIHSHLRINVIAVTICQSCKTTSLHTFFRSISLPLWATCIMNK